MAENEYDPKEKFSIQQDGMKFVSGGALARAVMAPHTGRFIKLHAFLHDVDADNVEEVLEKTIRYVDPNNPDELAFVTAIGEMYKTYHPDRAPSFKLW